MRSSRLKGIAMRRIGLVCVFALIASLAHAGKYNNVLNIGDAAPAWKKLPGVDGKEHSLDDLKQKKVVVVVFTCNSCPVAADYEDRILAFAKKYSEQVGVVAINVNKIPEDSLVKMKERAEKKKFSFPYLFDESQQIAKDYGAAFTPEFFVLGPERKIVYMGGMDDNSNAAQVKTNYLEPAVEAALAGKKPETQEAVARGCRIRFARERASKSKPKVNQGMK
jgi:peroxiredoxin